MRLLQAGVDTSVIALWLGHESVETTQIYLHADLSIKERAIARTAPPDVKPGRYRASDSPLVFLDGQRLCRPLRAEPSSRGAPLAIIRRSA
jgi:integrase/recombinase XerD